MQTGCGHLCGKQLPDGNVLALLPAVNDSVDFFVGAELPRAEDRLSPTQSRIGEPDALGLLRRRILPASTSDCTWKRS